MRILSIPALSMIALFFFSANVNAVVSCHCFQDRVYDPSRPDAADSYFLATVQNSLIASALNVHKKSIVKSKMGGANPDLLWVAYYVSDRTGLSFAEIFEAYTGAGGNWNVFAKKILLSADRLDRPFVSALANPSDLNGLARGAYRSVMISQLGIETSVLDRLEMTGATRKEQVLALFISILLAEKPSNIIKSVKSGKQTWGQSLAATGLDPEQIESSWKKLLKLHRLGL